VDFLSVPQAQAYVRVVRYHACQVPNYFLTVLSSPLSQRVTKKLESALKALQGDLRNNIIIMIIIMQWFRRAIIQHRNC
jgi:hypothetical protein